MVNDLNNVLRGRGANLLVTVAIVLVAAGALLISAGKTIQPGNVGVKIRTLGPTAGVDDGALGSGWHINMLGERIVEFPVIQRTYSYTREPDERGNENEEEEARQRT